MVHPTQIETFLKLLLVKGRIDKPTLVQILSRLGVKTRGQYVDITEEAALACFEGYQFEENIFRAALEDGVLKMEETELSYWLTHYIGSGEGGNPDVEVG